MEAWPTLPKDPEQKPAPNYNAPLTVINGRITLVGGRDAELAKLLVSCQPGTRKSVSGKTATHLLCLQNDWRAVFATVTTSSSGRRDRGRGKACQHSGCVQL